MTYRNPVANLNQIRTRHTYFGVTEGDLYSRVPGDTRRRLVSFIDMQRCVEGDHLQFLLKLFRLLDDACDANQEFFYYQDEAMLRWVLGPLFDEKLWPECDQQIADQALEIQGLCRQYQASWIKFSDADNFLHRFARARFKRFNATRLLELGRSRTARFRV